MGKRPTATTKKGKFMNPTDQYRKVERRKELKRNKLQRTAVRLAVLKAKDHEEIITELEAIDKVLFDPMAPTEISDKVLQDKRRRLLETFAKVKIMYVKSEPEQAAEMIKMYSDYEAKRNDLIARFRQIKSAESVNIDSIPLPAADSVDNEQSTTSARNHNKPLHSILKKKDSLSQYLSATDPMLNEPAAPPEGDPPDLSDSDDEIDHDSEMDKQRKIRFNEQDEGSAMINFQQQQLYPPAMGIRPQQGFPMPSRQMLSTQAVSATLSAPPSIRKQVGGQPGSSNQGPATIERKAQLKNLLAESTKFVPPSVRVRREFRDKQGRLRKQDPVPDSQAESLAQLKKQQDAAEMVTQKKVQSSKNSKEEDTAYQKFMAEMADLL